MPERNSLGQPNRQPATKQHWNHKPNKHVLSSYHVHCRQTSMINANGKIIINMNTCRLRVTFQHKSPKTFFEEQQTQFDNTPNSRLPYMPPYKHTRADRKKHRFQEAW